MARSMIPPPPRGIEAALSSFAAPSTGIRSKSKTSHVRVVVRIRPVNEDEKHCITSIHPVLPEAPPPTPGLLLGEAGSTHPGSPAPPPRKGPFAFLTPTKKKKGPIGSKTAQRDDEATPVVRNGHKLIAPSPGRPISQSQPEYGTATTLMAQQKFFEFDAIFAPEATQKEVYDRSVGDAVRRNIFRGYNTTIIAYGQTGSGKTFTMGGSHYAEMANFMDLSPTSRVSVKKLDTFAERSEEVDQATFEVKEDDGIIPRAIHDLFKAKQRHESASEVTIHLTYLEIYNDELRDLLVDGGDSPVGLKLSDHGDDGVVVKGLSSVVVKSPNEVRQLIDSAAKRRTTASTRLNMRSSRSHAICSLLVTINPATQNGSLSRDNMGNCAEVISAKLTLVDLAGSERIKETGVVGIHQQESININKDLFVLGKVVSALAEKGKAGNNSTRVHVPYRDSKLTRLLRHSLGGNCCTVIAACVSPTDRNLDESVNTLRYALRARTITNSVKQNVIKADMSPAECAALRGENKMLKTRVLDLQKHIQHLESKTEEIDSMSIVSSSTNEEYSLERSLDDSLEVRNEEQASLLVKNLSLESLDMEINEKKEEVERLRVEAAKLETTLREQQTESIPSKISGSHAAAGTNIEMVTLSKAVESDSAKSAVLQKQCARFAIALTSSEEKRSILASDNEKLLKTISSQTLQIESLIKQEKDNKEKISVLILQLEFEQQRLREHEESLVKARKELREIMDERDSYRMKLAVQADELNKRQTELSALESQAEVLLLALKCSQEETEALKKVADEKENHPVNEAAQLNEDEQNNRILSPRHQNTEGKPQGASSNIFRQPFGEKHVPSMNDSISSDPLISSLKTGGNDSTDSDHNAIRVHAAKMLFYANRAIERGSRESGSICSSFSSSIGSDFKPDMRDIRTMVNESGPLPRVVSATVPGKPPRAGERMSPARKSLGEQKTIISNIDKVKEMNGCSCKTNLFAGNPEHVEFYLPKLGVGCTCGKNDMKGSSFSNVTDAMALVNILRPWQVNFLKSENITTAEELVNAYQKEGGSLAKKMRKWRKDHKLVSVKTISCGVALHIWSRTCKAIIRSVLNQLAAGVKEVKMPDILDVSSDNRTAVSSLGCGSFRTSLAEF